MTEKLSLFVLALFLAGCASRPPAPPPPPPLNLDHTISLTWSQSFANNSACSSSVTVSCISGFNEGYLQGATQVQLHTDTAAVCTGTTDPKNCASTFNGILPIGNVTFYVTTTFNDQNGVAGVTSAANSPGVPVIADKATNVNATVGP
jgi:hypothetical protein